MNNEIWKQVPQFPDYSISSLGRVRSEARRIWNGHSYFLSQERLLKPNTLAKGYLQVTLRDGERRCPFLVHRLVALAFIPNPQDFDQINHINGVKDDNRVENLEWCNNSMNQLHAYRMGLNYHRELAGKPKRSVLLTSDKAGERIVFGSVAEAVRFLGKNTSANLQRVLHRQPHYNTIKGYNAKYI